MIGVDKHLVRQKHLKIRSFAMANENKLIREMASIVVECEFEVVNVRPSVLRSHVVESSALRIAFDAHDRAVWIFADLDYKVLPTVPSDDKAWI